MKTEPTEFRGEWWLPSTPDRRVAGTLRVSESGEISLDLIGSLRPPFSGGERTTVNGVTTVVHTAASDEVDGRYPRISGEASGNAITLADCFRTQLSERPSGDSLERVHAHKAFVGLWLDDHEPLEFLKVSVWLDWLVYWVGESAISRPMRFEERESGGIRFIAAELRAELLGRVASFDTTDGITVSIEHVIQSGGDSVSGVHVNQDFVLHVEAAQAIELDRLLKVASAVQSLVSIGVDRPASFRKMQVFHPDISMGEERLLPIDYLARWQLEVADSVETLHDHDVPFTLPDVGGEPGFAQLLAVALAHKSTLDRVMSTKHSHTMYPSDRLLNVVASLEGYHRQRRRDRTTPPTGSSTLKHKLQFCVDSMGVPPSSLVAKPDLLVKRLNSARQDVAHHYSTIHEQALDQYYLARAGYFIYVLCLLNEAGAPEKVLARVLDRQRAIFDRRRIEQVLAGVFRA